MSEPHPRPSPNAGPRFEGPAGRRTDSGQDLAEYAILIGLIALVVVGAVTLLGGRVAQLYQHIVDTLPFG